MHSLTRAAVYGSKVRTVFPVAGFVVEMLMSNAFASLRVPEIALGYAKRWMTWIAQIHVVPRDLIERVELVDSQEPRNRANQTPCRQSLDDSGGTDEISLHEACIFLTLDTKFLDTTDFDAVHIAHFRPSPAILAVPIHDMMVSICSAGVGGLQPAARINERSSSRFALM